MAESNNLSYDTIDELIVSNIKRKSLVPISENGIGINNPVFTHSVSSGSLGEHEQENAEEKPTIFTINETGEQNNSFARRQSLARKTSNIILQDVDIVIFEKVYTIRARTFINFKKSMQMIKPFIVLIIMIVILIGLFRIDVLVENGDNIIDTVENN